MRADRANNPLKIFIIALCVGFSAGVRATSDEPLLYADCKQQMLSLAETLWTPDQVSARTLDGKFQLTLRLGYRLRSYFEASNGLATKLALSAPGLRFLILFGMEGANEKLRADLDATLSAEEKRELDALTPLLRLDTVFLTLVNQLYTAGNQVFEHNSPWREVMMGDPLFVPLLATFCGAVCEKETKRIIGDFASRYVDADQIEISKQMVLALMQDDRLRLYLASLYSDVPFSMEGLTFPKNRIVLNAPEFIKALGGSAGYESLNDLNRILTAAWGDRTGHLLLTLPSGESLPFWRYANSIPGKEFTLALTHIVKGQDAQARTALDLGMAQLRKAIEIPPALETRIRATLFSAAMDPRFRLMALGEFLARGKVSPELILANIMARNTHISETRAGAPFMPMMARAQQVPLINAALLYASLVPNSKILEIGYEKPVLMVALRYFLPHIALAVGVDPAPLPPAQVTEGLKPKIELVRGKLLSDKAVTKTVEEKGPYHLIYGVDVFRKTYGGWGADFDPSTDMDAYLKWVHDHLSEGGTFLVLNDNETLPNFTRQQAERAGLTVVRWAEDWSLNASLREFVAQTRDSGEMRLYVFRKGDALPLGAAIATPAN